MKFNPRAIVAAVITAVALVADAGAHPRSPVFSAHTTVARVPVAPPNLARPETDLARGAKRTCVAAGQIVGATVLGDRTIEVELANGEHYHMEFADDCPFVGFYEGFYYKRTQAGMLCAGRDSVIGRSGLQCAIQHFHRHLHARP